MRKNGDFGVFSFCILKFLIFMLSSVNAFNLDNSKIMSFGKILNPLFAEHDLVTYLNVLPEL